MWKCKCGWEGELLAKMKVVVIGYFKLYYGCPKCGASSQEMEVE